MTPLAACFLLSVLLFSIGLAGVLVRRHAIAVLISLELMLNAANLNFLGFWRYGPGQAQESGMMFVLFAVAVAAAEAAVGLALVLRIHRHYQTTNLEQIRTMQG